MERFGQSYGLSIRGIRDGLDALLHDPAGAPMELSKHPGRQHVSVPEVDAHAGMGGSLIGTSRLEEMLASNDPIVRSETLTRMVTRLESVGIDLLYVIGGDGSMKAAHSIWTVADQMAASGNTKRRLSVVAIPKTMDNDILWMWQSFGFMSAVERATEFTVALRREAQSNPRLCVMQLFGSDSGFVVSHAALASNVCDLALVPEREFTIEGVREGLRSKLNARLTEQKRGYGVVVMGETAIPKDIDDFINPRNSYDDVRLTEDEKEAIEKFVKAGRRVSGQTSDALRSGSLKVVSRSIGQYISEYMGEHDNSYWKRFRVFTNEPRHLIRAIDPNPLDRILGQRLGTLAVDNAMAGYTDFMVSQWLTEYVLVPLPLVVLGRKRLYTDGVFWKSVVAATGQPDPMT